MRLTLRVPQARDRTEFHVFEHQSGGRGCVGAYSCCRSQSWTRIGGKSASQSRYRLSRRGLKDRAAKLRSLPRWWPAGRYWFTFCRVPPRTRARIDGRGRRRALGIRQPSDWQIAGNGVSMPRFAAPATPNPGADHGAGAAGDAGGGGDRQSARGAAREGVRALSKTTQRADPIGAIQLPRNPCSVRALHCT